MNTADDGLEIGMGHVQDVFGLSYRFGSDWRASRNVRVLDWTNLCDSSDGEPEQETHQGSCGSMNTADDGLEIGMGRVQDVFGLSYRFGSD
jgi:hypothetical protein